MRTPRVLLSALIAVLLPACGRSGEGAAPSTVAAADSIATDTLYGTPPADIVRVTPVEIDVPNLPAGLDGTRIAVLSDFQLGLWSDNAAVAEAAVKKAAQSGADVVVLLGDYIARGNDTVQLARVLAPLRGKPAFAVLGDRDIRSDSTEAHAAHTLRQAGVLVLRHETAPFVRGGDTLRFAGLDPHLLGRGSAEQEWAVASLGGSRTVLLSHVPGLVPRVEQTPYAAALAGHTFCGNVEIAGTPRLSWLNSEILANVQTPGVPRLYRIGKTTLFVTCGTGYSFVPVRFGAPPEVGLVTLRRSGAAPAEAPAPPPIDSLLRQYERADTGRKAQ
jgi:predicted MPP superfamily phosphohydrolase